MKRVIISIGAALALLAVSCSPEVPPPEETTTTTSEVTTTTENPTTTTIATTTTTTTTTPSGVNEAPRSRDEAVNMSALDGYLDRTEVRGPLTIQNKTVPIIFVWPGADLTLDNVVVNGGIWIYAESGQPSPKVRVTNSAFMEESRIQVGSSAPDYINEKSLDLKFENSYFYSAPGTSGQHKDGLQVLGIPTDIVFNNVGFEIGGPYNGTQTAPLNMQGERNLFNSIWIGGAGNSYYGIYNTGATNIYRCIETDYTSLWYPNADPPVVEDCDTSSSKGEK